MTTDVATPGGVVDRVMERSRAGPVLVVVDDAEWSDAMTVEDDRHVGRFDRARHRDGARDRRPVRFGTGDPDAAPARPIGGTHAAPGRDGRRGAGASSSPPTGSTVRGWRRSSPSPAGCRAWPGGRRPAGRSVPSATGSPPRRRRRSTPPRVAGRGEGLDVRRRARPRRRPHETRRTDVVDVAGPSAVPRPRRLRAPGRRPVRRPRAARRRAGGAGAGPPPRRRDRRVGQRQVVARSGRARAARAQRPAARHRPVAHHRDRPRRRSGLRPR